MNSFTGRKMAATMIGFFAVVIAVNATMATLAARSFGGTVVDNSYVASQHFNRWLDEAARQQSAGIAIDAGRQGDRVSIRLTHAGAPIDRATITAIATHPLGRLPERSLIFEAGSDGHYRSVDSLPAGRWRLRIKVRSPGGNGQFSQEIAA